MNIAHRLMRHLCPMVIVALGVFLWDKSRQHCRERQQKMEDNQEKILETLKEIRDELRAKKA
ncbi:MAG: hypothetical protein HY815_19525 [Candidatus Riflebacteria bacterium]|nr:hypothetical protein [Candidatus Riflebacteria bacterium]